MIIEEVVKQVNRQEQEGFGIVVLLDVHSRTSLYSSLSYPETLFAI